MRSLVLAGLLLAALTGCGSGRASPPPLRDAHSCPGAPGFTCSTLVVPLDHSGRVPGTLNLEIGAADNRRAPRGVLLVLAGGPGEAGLPILDGFVSRALGAERHQYRIVVMDQRGTGAGALACPALQAQMGSSDLTPPTPGAVRTCARMLGKRRAFFGTDDVVADMESLRQALGVHSWTVDGISYGTFVGERYAIDHPGRVRRLVLDSVVPQIGETDLGAAEFAGVRRVLGSVCGMRCLSDLSFDVRRYHLGPQLLDALTFDSIADPTYRRFWDVPRALHAARGGSMGALNAFLTAARRYQRAPAAALDQGLHASALCADWRFPWGDSAATTAGRVAALRRAVRRLPAAAVFPFDAVTAAGSGFVRQCLPWPPASPTPLARGRIGVPTLLVDGSHDLSTPLEWARKQLALTPKGRLVVVPGAGHSVQYRARSDVGRRAVAEFLLAR
jgi:pimeloyl-ACP methyl ester carboxylesterase